MAFVILSIFQFDPVLTFYTHRYDTLGKTRGNAKTYREIAQRIEHFEQESRIKAILRRKTIED